MVLFGPEGPSMVPYNTTINSSMASCNLNPKVLNCPVLSCIFCKILNIFIKLCSVLYFLYIQIYSCIYQSSSVVSHDFLNCMFKHVLQNLFKNLHYTICILKFGLSKLYRSNCIVHCIYLLFSSALDVW